MRKPVAIVLAALLVNLSMPAFGAVPICVLGGPTAMDTSRQLAEGESFAVTDRPLVVNLQFWPTKDHPEQVGECMLPSHSEVAVKNGIMQWAKLCGNDEVNRNVFVTPFVALRGLKGDHGDIGPMGPRGPQGPDGRDFVPNLVEKKESKISTLGWVGIGAGATAVVVVLIKALAGGGSGSSKPKGDGNTIP